LKTNQARAIAFALLLPAASLVHSVERSPTDLVLVQRGTLPILLTAPHGGREAIPGIDPRHLDGQAKGADGRTWGGVRGGADPNTDVLARRIAAEIRKLTGKDPYLVVAKFERRYVDANRPPELAFDNPNARPYYDYYHQSIRRFVDEIRASYPAGLLIDVHGQSKDPDVLMRGTINGRAVEHLLRRAGVDAVTGPNGLFGQLEAHGFRIFPGNDVPPRGRSEDAGFNGGYALAIYGSHNRAGIDAMQLEIGASYRRTAVLDKTAREIAGALVAFHEAYLKQAPAR
jgi:hypothetical protein